MAKILLGSESLEVLDTAGVQPIWIDVITDGRDIGGIVRLSLGTFVGEGDAPPAVVVATRLRFTMATAINLRDVLDGFIKGGAKAKKRAN